MWNVVGNGDVECDGERDVEYGGERWCGMLQRTEMWNVAENFDVECSRERLREIWWRTVMLGRNA